MRISKRKILLNFSLICSLILITQDSYGQNSLADPVFKHETAIVKKMLSDSAARFKNDTITIELSYYSNGRLKSKNVFSHPEGPPKEAWLFYYLNYAVTSYKMDGGVSSYVEWNDGKNHGNYLMFDDEKFVTHWVFENGKLVDVKNENCRFLDPKGNVITKEEFFNQFESEDYGQWGYYLFAKEYGEYSELECCDFVMYSDKFPIPGGGKQASKLIKRLNQSC